MKNRDGKFNDDEELQKVREKLLKINQKIKKQACRNKDFSALTPKSSPASNVSLEEMHAKLRAINDYICDRAQGKEAHPVVLEKPVRRINKLSSRIVEEPVLEIGENLKITPQELKEDSASVGLPETGVRVEKEDAARIGVGLDLGTAYIVASREVEGRRVFVKNERNSFLSVRCDEATQELLTKMKIKYVAMDKKLYVLGAMALELGDIFGREVQRSMSMGILNPSEAESIPIIKLLVENILWPPRKKGEVCCFSIPSSPIDRDQDTIYHRGVFDGILRSIGFEPMVIDEGYAVVLSEMEQEDFTGIGVSCGAGMVNICAAFKSVPVVSFSITRGGDWIDRSAATVLGVPSSRVTAIKEHGINIKTPSTREEEAIAIYYRNYIHYFLQNMAQALGKGANTPRFKEPVNIVFAGGSCMVAGFLEVVKEEIETIDFTFALGKLRIAQEPFTSVARGCLFNAMNAGG